MSIKQMNQTMPEMPTLALMVLIILLLFCTSCWAPFIIKPTTLEISASLLTPNSTAPFYCHYERADDRDFIISWEVNNMSLSGMTTTVSPLPYSATLHTLSLPATLEYNGSFIHCIVIFRDDRTREFSEPPAYFYLLQEGENTTSIPTGFSRAPVFYDSRYILAVGEVAVISCQHCDTNIINWRLNGTQIRYRLSQNGYIPDHEGVNISYSVQNFCGLTVELTITDLSLYNETAIECVAGYRRDIVGMKGFELLVQGVLDAVGNLRRSQLEQHEVMYVWDPPFTLNLTNSDTDIAYCLQLDPVSCHNNIVMNGVTTTDGVCDPFQQCGITEPRFIVPSCEIDDVLNHVRVVPRSNVERANNGTPANHTDKFQFFGNRDVSYAIDIATDELIQIKITLYTPNHNNGVQPINIMLNLTVISSSSQEAITCATESDVDVVSGETTSRSLDVLMCSSQAVQENIGLYMANIYVPNMNCSISNQSEISTHLLQNVQTNTTPQPGEIVISGEFIDGALPDNATATGFIAIAYNTESPDTIKRRYEIARRLRTQSHAEARISGLSESNYRVSVFSLQQDGLPFNKSASTARDISNIPLKGSNATVTNEMDPSNITVNATSSNSSDCVGVKLDCTFNESAAADDEDQCVAFILEPLQMVSNYGLLDFSVYVLNRSNNSTTASVCLPQGRNYSTLIIDVFLFRDQEITGGPRTVSEIHDYKQDLPRDTPTISTKTIVIIVVCVVVVTVVLLILVINIFTLIKMTLKRKASRSLSLSQNQECVLPLNKLDSQAWLK